MFVYFVKKLILTSYQKEVMYRTGVVKTDQKSIDSNKS